MKKLLLIALLTNQAMAADLTKLGLDLGKIYQKVQEVKVQSSREEEVRKQVSASLMAGVLKITFLPLNELKEQMAAAQLTFTVGAQGFPEISILPSEALPTLEESMKLQSLYIQYEVELAEAEKRLTETFYSSSSYRLQLEAFQGLKFPLQEKFSPSINMQEGHRALENMITEFAELGFRWERKVQKGKIQFIFNQAHFQKVYQVSGPEALTQKNKILTQVLQGPVRKLNYLKSVHSYLSQHFGVEEFGPVLRELISKLK